MKAERVIQSVMAICNALAAVESQEITGALNQLPPCPSRMQPKIQKVRSRNERQREAGFALNAKTEENEDKSFTSATDGRSNDNKCYSDYVFCT